MASLILLRHLFDTQSALLGTASCGQTVLLARRRCTRHPKAMLLLQHKATHKVMPSTISTTARLQLLPLPTSSTWLSASHSNVYSSRGAFTRGSSTLGFSTVMGRKRCKTDGPQRLL